MVLKNKIENNGFNRFVWNEHFICAFITRSEAYSDGLVKIMKRHNDTDEIFVLLKGDAVLLTRENIGDTCEVTKLEPLTAYTVPASTWHHLAASEDAALFVTESGALDPKNTDTADVSSENIFAELN
ncbi:MAG: hypothetical protein J6V50_01845 [Clostridia bacterium]|nr:hypothetical protein [Clostridia bacterium]